MREFFAFYGMYDDVQRWSEAGGADVPVDREESEGKRRRPAIKQLKQK
jgi:hypothetical protein